MVHAARKFGYELAGNSRRVNMGNGQPNCDPDQESEQYIKSRNFYIRGQ